MYKDKDKQKQASKEAMRRRRAKQGITKGITSKGITESKPELNVIPEQEGITYKVPQQVKGGTCWCCGVSINKVTVCCGPCAWSGRAKAKRAGTAPPRIAIA